MQQRSEDTRNRILSAAEKLFSHSGYEATGVAEICLEAGVSKGAFYHHFPTKHDVFMALLKGWLKGLDIELEHIRQGSEKVPETLLKMTSTMRFIFQTAEDRLPMFLEFWTQASRDPQVWEATIAPYQTFQATFASLVQEGIDEGSLRPVNTENASRVIMALATGLLLQGLLDPQGADWTEVSYQGMQMLIQGLKMKDET